MCTGGSRGGGSSGPPWYTTASLQTQINPSGKRTALNFSGSKAGIRSGASVPRKGVGGKIAEIVGSHPAQSQRADEQARKQYNPNTGQLY